MIVKRSDDARSHQVVLVAHCLLNANAKAEGLAHFAGVHAIIGELAGRGYGIVQMPCPEMQSEGCGRKPVESSLYESAEYRELCSRLADKVASDVESYLQCGVTTVAAVGYEGSRTCAISRGSLDEPAGEPGVFTQELRARLDSRGVHFVCIAHDLPEDNIPEVLAHLR